MSRQWDGDDEESLNLFPAIMAAVLTVFSLAGEIFHWF